MRFIFSLHIRFIEALCLSFSFENLRNFQNKSMRDRHGGSHVYQRGAAIPISILLGFLRTFKRKTWVFAVPRFVFLSTSLLGTGKGKNK